MVAHEVRGTTLRGVVVGQRQVEGLARAAAVDFETFYDNEPRPVAQRRSTATA